MVRRVGRHQNWRCSTANPIAQSKPSVDLDPGAHVVVANSEQGSMERSAEQSLELRTVNMTVERRCGWCHGRSAGADALNICLEVS